MSNKVLYRKYRSRSLDEIVGQDHIRDTFKASLKKKRLAHAYLFVGPRGTGKTSVARIIAFAINEKKYDDAGHIDIIEIDAASNRRIDEIRELRDKIHIAPLESRYKIYIIDEVHMLTREAFNALLKTLEEPPEHAIFVLATTEGHKVPATITSRTQKFLFRPIPDKLIASHLKKIAAKEKIKIDEAALLAVAKYGKGSFRDSIGLLDQLSNHLKKINKQTVAKFLGHGSDEDIDSLIDSVSRGDIKSLSSKLDEILAGGSQAHAIAEQVVGRLLIAETTTEGLNLIDKLLMINQSLLPNITLEVELQRAALHNKPTKVEEDAPLVPKPEKFKKSRRTHKTKTNATNNKKYLSVDKKRWAKILNNTKSKNNTLYAVLRMARAEISGSTLRLVFPFKFHASRFEDKKLISSFRESAREVLKEVDEIVIKVDPTIKPTSGEIAEDILAGKTTRSRSKFSRVVETFGGGEVVEL